MPADLRLLLWLRGRQLRGSAAYWLGTLGYELDEQVWYQQIYGLYLLAIGLGWLVLMWAWAVDQAATIGAQLGSNLQQQALAALPFGLFALATLAAMRCLRESPLKLSFPDNAYLAAAPLARPALALLAFGGSLLRVAPLVAMALALITTALAGPAPATGISADWRGLGLGLLLAAAGWSIAWALGIARLALPPQRRHPALWLSPLLLWLPVAVFPALLQVPGRIVVGALLDGTASIIVAVLPALALAATAALVGLARRINLTEVADESAVYAQVEALGLLKLFDPALARRTRRRYAQAQRRPWIGLPRAAGIGALLGRGLVGFARRPGTLLAALLWGAAICHLGAWLIVQQAGGWALLAWLFLLLAAPPRAMLQVFQADVAEPFLRQLLPVRTLTLLLADAALPLLGIGLAGLLLRPLYGGELLPAAGGGILALLLALLTALALATEHAPLRPGLLRLRAEALLLFCAALVALAGWLSSTPTAALLVAIALLVWLGRHLAAG
jgi:hypothetical protein